MKKITLLLTLALTVAVTSCTNYDDDFKSLNASISDLNSAVAELKSQVAGFSSLQTGITAIDGRVTALQTAVNSLPGELDGLKASLETQASEIQALQTGLNTLIANYATSEDLATAQEAINALAAQLTATQEDVAVILESNNVYSGDVLINSSATLEFAVGLGEKVRVINGSTAAGSFALKIDYSSLTASEVAAANEVAKKIVGVVGNVSLTSTAAKGSIDVSNLKSVAGSYTVVDADAMDDALAIITGAASFDYDGGYNQPNLASAASVTVADYQTDAATGVVGTLEVNFRNLVTTNFKSDALGAGTSDFASATNVVLNEGVLSLTADAATNVEIWASNNTSVSGLTVFAREEGSVVTIAGRVDSGGSSPSGRPLSVTGHATSVVNANAVTKVGDVTITAKEVNMSAVTSAGAVDLTSTTSVDFPALTLATSLTASSALDVSVPNAVFSGAVSVATAKSVTIKSLAGALTATAVEELVFTGLVTDFVATGAGYTNLVSLDVTGDDLGSILAGSPKLESFTTSGTIDKVDLTGATIIESVSFNHTHVVGGSGSILIVKNNPKLSSLTSSSDFLAELTVSGNTALTTMDFSSFQNVIDLDPISITIKSNKLSGSFSDAVAPTPTTAYVEASITQSSLLTLKPFIQAYKAAKAAVGSTTGAIILDIQVENVGTVAAPETLAKAMFDNRAVSLVIDNTTDTEGIDSVNEFLLIN